MRQSIAIAALVALTGLSSQAHAQSRYGPPPAARQAPAEPAAQAIPAHAPQAPQAPQTMLGWPGKTVVQPPVAAAPSEPQQPVRPGPVAPWSQRMASLTPPASPAPVAPVAVAPALPTHLYDAPPPRALPAPRPAPAAPVQAAAPTQPAPAATQTALLGGPAAPRQAAPRPAAAPVNPSAPAGPRFYSVYREYGLSPDAIPTAPNTGRGQETTLRELPSTPSLAGQDDTQYLPSRPNAEAASRRTF